MFAIKAEVRDPRATMFTFSAQKTMYGGKRIAKGDTVFVFASENDGGPCLIASGVVTSAKALPKRSGVARHIFDGGQAQMGRRIQRSPVGH